MIELKVLDSVFDISAFTFKRLLSVGSAGSAALSFGSTYSSIFKHWKKMVSTSSTLPAFFPVDERVVDIDDPESNWGTFKKLFLSDCGSDSDLERHPETVEDYRRILSDYFAAFPVFDITFLGLGSDGHTASLFPDTCPAESDNDWKAEVLQTMAPFNPHLRLSLGPELIAASRQLIMVVTGEAKKTILQKYLIQLSEMDSMPKDSPLLPPVKIVRRRENLCLNTLVLADTDAALSLSVALKAGYIQ